MIHSKAEITTGKASRYLQQMCKHFGHKVTVAFTPEAGEIHLPFGDGTLQSADGRLTLQASAASEDDVERLEQVLGSHLERFAFRENISVTWTRST